MPFKNTQLRFEEEREEPTPSAPHAPRDALIFTSSRISRLQQKRAIRKQYAASVNARNRASPVENHWISRVKSKVQRVTAPLKSKKTIGILLGLFFMVSLFLGMVSSCSVLAQAVLNGVSSTTYPSTDEAMLGAEAVYARMETQLQEMLDHYTQTHSYDEYHFNLDEIKHDPYVLISLLTAYYGGEWTLEEAQGMLEMLFARQYKLTESVSVETRYDDEGNPYSWTVCTVTLENFDLSHLPVYLLSESQLEVYSVYMRNQGNRPDLFPSGEYPNVTERGEYQDYDVPAEALEDERFAAMLAEAEKYLGFPYVWGGSSPSTSFDCSGYVSWVVNHSGWNFGRLGAQALYNRCTPVSQSAARPGDLVFFTKTYDAPNPVSHVGIYVGNSRMLHCGDPISYQRIDTNYWTNHLYGFGRLPR